MYHPEGIGIDVNSCEPAFVRRTSYPPQSAIGETRQGVFHGHASNHCPFQIQPFFHQVEQDQVSLGHLVASSDLCLQGKQMVW